jgi:myo-inositol-1-phosphate synthase
MDGYLLPEIRVALIGVGNSASALIQGTQYYKDAKEDTTVPGLMHVNYGGYHIRDISFVAAFEVNKDKIGKDLSKPSGQTELLRKIRGPPLRSKVACTHFDGVAPTCGKL